ncbi:S-(hydroxymethyl)glutathione dehydrogenase / alcohol dehydrogenase [Haloechinothrix alba]|uniref:S-(Hydroxymethyl)glutathione dehydrogenase / alcohol dehydrogenase n=1 Tax=Haloechinothrix alba TaxID=664784 RepID=A0A239ABN4_9PSEU|nr:NDMA-dependent alcohol dehydrogenase [Haloechinothrix alba]SNR92802.1 S-(hydroxymethyl)glutathione dehydrogenase / alcohol dehydrogenase [Haloechinothrix alba]
MRTDAAIVWERGQDWSVEPIELDSPRRGEVRVRMEATGLCQSDDHLTTGSLPSALPIIGGHEGAGVVEDVGEGVTRVAPGDHVVFSSVPSCGLCSSCASGHQNQCDRLGVMGSGRQLADQTSRHHAREQDLALMCLLGTFARHSVLSEAQCIPVDKDIPLDRACLVSCAVITGWGSVVHASGIRPGDDVVVVGAGGVGVNAIQAARFAGGRRIIAMDPLPAKQELALHFGATHVADGVDNAYELVKTETRGGLAQRVIVTMDVARGDVLQPILRMTSKRGRIVLCSLAAAGPQPLTLNLFDLTMREKQFVGSLAGSANPNDEIPRLLDLYRDGLLDLDSQISRTYTLDDINQGCIDLREGNNLRGVVLCQR